MIRKITNLSLVLSLLMTSVPLSANNSATEMFKDLGATNLQNNVSGFQEYRGANGEMVYGFGGSLVVKRPASVYPQWYHFQAPEIAASCSGVSFKGMFGSIINFDELERQFSEAGESLAWGILVGIIYSLPGVAEIFAKLDAWAKKIQQMLANSCRSGIAIGKVMGSEGFNQAGSAIGGMIGDDTKSWFKRQGQNFGGIVDSIDTALNCGATASEWISSGECPDMKKEVRDQLSTAYLAAPSIFASAAYLFQKEHNTFPFNTSKGKFTEVDPSDSMKLASGTADFYNDISLALIITSVVGDVVLTEDDYASLAKGMEVVYDDDSTLDSQERQKAIKGLQNSMTNMSQYVCGAYQGDETLRKQVAHFLVYGKYAAVTPNTPAISEKTASATSSSAAATGPTSGSTPSGTTSGETLGEMLVGNMIMPQFGVFQSPGGVNTIGTYQILAHEPFVPGDKLTATVKDPIYNYSGIMQSAIDAKNCYLFEDATACSKVTFSLFDLDAQRFLAKVYRNTLDPAEKGALETRFLDYAIYHMAYAIKERISAVVQSYAGMTDIYAKEGSLSATNNAGHQSELSKCMVGVNTRLREFSTYLDDEVETFLKNRLDGKQSPEAVYQIFLEQNRLNMQHALERLNRK